MNNKLKIPRALRSRLEAVAAAHEFKGHKEVAQHFVDRGLTQYGATEGPLGKRLAAAVEEQGYASVDELVEHLLLRGLGAYEDAPADPAQMAARLRGLGYID